MSARISQDDYPGDVGGCSFFFRSPEKNSSIPPASIAGNRLAQGRPADILHGSCFPRVNPDHWTSSVPSIAGKLDAAPAKAHPDRESTTRQDLLHRGEELA